MTQARMTTALIALNSEALPAWLATANERERRWVAAQGFVANAGTHCVLPDADGGIGRVLVGVLKSDDLYALAQLPMQLPVGDYALSDEGLRLDPLRAALGFALGSYQFNRYRKAKRAPARLRAPAGIDAPMLEALTRASTLTRNLVNTPTEDMGPAHLAEVAQSFAIQYGAKFREWVGEDLIASGFPAIHAVGRASHRPPRLIELYWGDVAHPRVAIVGKGVCFDTGGLDIKPADGMRNMKKDMGGAAHALALAELVMRLRLPIRLHLLVPAVENAISSNAYRPGEVIATRKGLSVEIDNTDAEGRIVLCDALTYAVEQAPDLIVDFATLTGAARIALGADLPPIFGNDDALRDAAVAAGRATQDPIWPMPLWQPYLSMLESNIADIANSGASRYAGCITAALYLQRFVPDSVPWLHLDTYAWNDTDRPGRPRGGEALGLRAIFELLRQRYL
jgi:leucyl aminopeptidase